MVFSFFRKDKQADTPPSVPSKPDTAASGTAKAKGPVVHEESPTEMLMNGSSPLDGITVTEGSTEISSVAEEAAIFFANDRADQAIIALLQHVKEIQQLKDAPEQKDYQPWLMLFDLYHMQSMKQAFEELALDFVVKFERSPPAWTGMEIDISKEVKPATAANYFALTGVLTGESESQFQQLHQVVKKAGNLRLELSKIKGIEPTGSRLLLETLQGLRKTGTKIQYIGASTVINQLKKAVETPDTEEQAKFHWLLLMEFHQILGKQDDFEDLAINYAVNFEVSPPSWEQLAEQAEVEESSEPVVEQPAADSPARDAFVIKGVISANSEQILKDLTEFAKMRQEVIIDMSQVSRVDFVCVGNFLNLLIQFFTSGKQVFIEEPNEMVLALFIIMGVDQFSTIHRKKPR